MDQEILTAAHHVADVFGFDARAFQAVVEVESAGKAWAMVEGQRCAIIRFEGHYFYRRLSGSDRKRAVAEGIASPDAGAVTNPADQPSRYKMLARAKAINATAALESCSWGLGQVMGANWRDLGFGSVDDLVATANQNVEGQLELMALFIDLNGLRDEMEQRNWAAFARRYNGPSYAINGYDAKLAAAYARLAPGAEQAVRVLRQGSSGSAVRDLQESLRGLGHKVRVDGVFGTETDAAVRKLQGAEDLRQDGIVGPKTAAAIEDRLRSQNPVGAAPPAQETRKSWLGSRTIAGTATAATGALAAVSEAVDAVSDAADQAKGLLGQVTGFVTAHPILTGAAVLIVIGLGVVVYARRSDWIQGLR